MHNILRILFLSCLMLIFACGAEESANLDPQVVRVVDDEFSPKVIRVEPGTTVIWESGGANDHNVIASDVPGKLYHRTILNMELLQKAINMSTHLMSLEFTIITVRIMEPMTKEWLER